MNETIESLSQRVGVLECEIARIKAEAKQERLLSTMGWADDDAPFLEAVEEGRKYRESFRPTDSDADS